MSPWSQIFMYVLFLKLICFIHSFIQHICTQNFLCAKFCVIEKDSDSNVISLEFHLEKFDKKLIMTEIISGPSLSPVVTLLLHSISNFL